MASTFVVGFYLHTKEFNFHHQSPGPDSLLAVGVCCISVVPKSDFVNSSKLLVDDE